VVVPTTPPPFYLEAALESLDKLISLNPTALYFSHFGKATDAVKRLKDHKEQLKLWAKITVEGVKNNQSAKQICSEIFEQDPIMRKLAGYFSEHSVYSITVMDNDIEGFMDYARRLLASGRLSDA
jgi:hypothetical protein